MLESLIYDWNKIGAPAKPPRVMLDDETLRDGLQSPSVRTPTIAQKIEILHLIDKLGIDTADIGLPGAGPHVVARRRAAGARNRRGEAEGARQLRGAHDDRRHHADCRDQQRTGLPIEVGMFIGSSPIRQYTEGLDASSGCCAAPRTRSSSRSKEGLAGDVRHRGHDARRIRRRCAGSTSARSVPARIASASPTPSATPRRGARRRWCDLPMQVIKDSGADVGLDWHGHRDRDLAIINSIAALEAGATRVHAAALGIGERVGNTPMDLLLVNLVVMGFIDRDLAPLMAYCRDGVRGLRRARFPTTIRSSAGTRSAPPPASTPRRSSRRGRRAIAT